MDIGSFGSSRAIRADGLNPSLRRPRTGTDWEGSGCGH